MSSVIANHLPSEIYRELILNQPDFNALKLFCEETPSNIDEVVGIYTTTGLQNRADSFGSHTEYNGIQIIVRSLQKQSGYNLCAKLVNFLDTVNNVLVDVDTDQYNVWSCLKRGSILYLGYELPEKKRHIFSLNYVSPITTVLES